MIDRIRRASQDERWADGGPAPRTPVSRRRAVTPAAPTGSEPWRESYNAILALIEAPTFMEYRRLLPGFGRAYRELEGHCRKAKQAPRKYRGMAKDPALFRAVRRLRDAGLNSVVFLGNATPEIRWKLTRLIRFCSAYVGGDDAGSLENPT